MFNLSQQKINKYYNLTDKTLVYLVALVLYLSLKWKYVKKNQKANQVQLGKEKVKDFQEKLYKSALTTPLVVLAALEVISTERPKNDFFEWLKGDDEEDSIKDEYARYCALL